MAKTVLGLNPQGDTSMKFGTKVIVSRGGNKRKGQKGCAVMTELIWEGKYNKTKDLLDVAGARRIAERVKLPAQFAALAPKVKEFFEHKAFGKTVDLNDMEVVRALPHTPPRPQGISA